MKKFGEWTPPAVNFGFPGVPVGSGFARGVLLLCRGSLLIMLLFHLQSKTLGYIFHRKIDRFWKQIGGGQWPENQFFDLLTNFLNKRSCPRHNKTPRHQLYHVPSPLVSLVATEFFLIWGSFYQCNEKISWPTCLPSSNSAKLVSIIIG